MSLFPYVTVSAFQTRNQLLKLKQRLAVFSILALKFKTWAKCRHYMYTVLWLYLKNFISLNHCSFGSNKLDVCMDRQKGGWMDGWFWKLLITYKFKFKPNGENLLPVTHIFGFWLGAMKSSNIQAAVSLVVQHFYRGSNIFTGTSASARPYTCFCTGMLTACLSLSVTQAKKMT